MATGDLWSLAMDHQYLDSDEMARAIERQCLEQPAMDYRSRLLVREAFEALKSQWGAERLQQWMTTTPALPRLESILREEFGERGFPSLPHRIVEVTRPEVVRQYLRELGLAVPGPVKIIVGGSIALMLRDFLARYTEDIDLVDEIPAEIRSLHDQMRRLSERYGLHVAHFQSHYLPPGWAERVSFEGDYGRLGVYLVDPLDILVGKLFSKREKDLDDVRALTQKVQKVDVVVRLRQTCSTLLSEERLRQQAQHNWYILYGEDLPTT